MLACRFYTLSKPVIPGVNNRLPAFANAKLAPFPVISKFFRIYFSKIVFFRGYGAAMTGCWDFLINFAA